MSEEYRGRIAEAPMTETWKQWQGQTVNGEFQLRQYLGGSAHNGVFLTEYDRQPTQIHLISGNSPQKEHQLAAWQLATELSHPNLMRVFQVGLCQLDGEEVFYAVTEFVDENLAQILAQRPLTPDETSEMLKPALDALGYLHKRGLVHRAISPVNIGAIGDQLKLSTDSLGRAGDPIRNPAEYDPPEALASPAGDAWSLGMTLVEVLTQRLPSWHRNAQGDPDVPQALPTPLRDIAQHCLRQDARQRWSVEEIANHLNPPAVSPVSASPSARPAAPESSVATASKTAAPAKPPVAVPPVRTASRAPQTSLRAAAPKKNRFLAPVLIVLVVLAAFAGVKLITGSPGNAVQVPLDEKKAPENAVLPPLQQPISTTPSAEEKPTPSAPPESSATRVASAPKAAEPTPQRQEDVAAAEPVDGEIVHQVLPEVPQKALRTIRGTVRVGIKANVDASGNVTDANIDSSGPSAYFANLALHAARDWKFASNAGASGDWMLYFAFTTDGVRASASPSSR